MFEEWLYRRLISSPHFHYYVRRLHAIINDLPPPVPPGGLRGRNHRPNFTYPGTFKPTTGQKFNAFFKIWKEEMKDAFLFRK